MSKKVEIPDCLLEEVNPTVMPIERDIQLLIKDGVARTKKPAFKNQLIAQVKAVSEQYGCGYESWMTYQQLARGAARTVSNQPELSEFFDSLQRRLYKHAGLSEIDLDVISEGRDSEESLRMQRELDHKAYWKEQSFKSHRKFGSGERLGDYLREKDGKLY